MTHHSTPSHFHLNTTINNIVDNTPVDPQDAAAALRVITRQTPLIISEFNELKAALADFNFSEVRDGIAGVIVTCEGMLHRLGRTKYKFSTSQEQLARADIFHKTEVCLNDIQQTYLEPAHGIQEFSDLCAAANCICAIGHMYDLAKVYNIDVAADQRAVYISNLSKFDTDIQTAMQSAQKYLDMGVTVVIEEIPIGDLTYFIIKSPVDQTVNGKDYPEGKFLKSINFKEPQWQEIKCPEPTTAEISG